MVSEFFNNIFIIDLGKFTRHMENEKFGVLACLDFK